MFQIFTNAAQQTIADLRAKIDEIGKSEAKLTATVEQLNSDIEKRSAFIREKDDRIKDLEKEISLMNREFEIRVQERLQALRDEMKESLISSDLLRTEALAKLEVYQKMDTKADANTIKEMVGKLIESMSKNNIQVVK